jgi:hypothetical protein
MRHGLFIVGSISGQVTPLGPQGFPHAGHIAMPEDRPYASEQWLLHRVDRRSLVGEIAHQRLCHGQSDMFGHRPIPCVASLLDSIGVARRI